MSSLVLRWQRWIAFCGSTGSCRRTKFEEKTSQLLRSPHLRQSTGDKKYCDISSCTKYCEVWCRKQRKCGMWMKQWHRCRIMRTYFIDVWSRICLRSIHDNLNLMITGIKRYKGFLTLDIGLSPFLATTHLYVHGTEKPLFDWVASNLPNSQGMGPRYYKKVI